MYTLSNKIMYVVSEQKVNIFILLKASCSKIKIMTFNANVSFHGEVEAALSASAVGVAGVESVGVVSCVETSVERFHLIY